MKLSTAITNLIDLLLPITKGEPGALSKNSAAAYLSSLRKLELPEVTAKEMVDIDFGDIERLVEIGTSPSQQKNIRKAVSKVFSTQDMELPKDVVTLPLYGGTIEQAATQLLVYLTALSQGDEQGFFSPQTATTYLYALQKWMNSKQYAATKSKDASELSIKVLQSYFVENAWGGSSHNQHVTMFASMERLAQAKIGDIDKLRTVTVDVAVKEGQYLTSGELDRLTKGDDPRSNALVAIIISTLATIEEVQALRICDVGNGEVTYKLRSLQKSKLRIPDNHFKLIKAWADIAEKQAGGNKSYPLFPNPLHVTKPLSRNSFWKILSKAMNSEGKRIVSIDSGTGAAVQCLRVSSSRRLYAEGYDVEVLADIAGVKDFLKFIKVTPDIEQTRANNLQKNALYKKL